MNRSSARWLAPICGAAVGMYALSAFCDSAPRSYDSIVARNAFGLRPKPEPPPPPAPEPEKPGDLKLTGISTMLGTKKAHLMWMERGKGTPKYYSLPIATADGPESDGIRVLDIDEKAGSVKVRFNEKELLMTFEKDGLTNAPAPLVAAVPGRGPGNPATPGATYTAPGVLPSPAPPNPGPTRPGEGLRSIPTRTMRTTVEPQSGSAGGVSLSTQPGQEGVAQVWNNPNTVNLTLGARDRGRLRPVNQPVPPAQDSGMTAEEAMILMEVTREVHRADIEAGNFPPLPPTPLSPEFRTGAAIPVPPAPGNP